MQEIQSIFKPGQPDPDWLKANARDIGIALVRNGTISIMLELCGKVLHNFYRVS
jgi:hypothetical protein